MGNIGFKEWALWLGSVLVMDYKIPYDKLTPAGDVLSAIFIAAFAIALVAVAARSSFKKGRDQALQDVRHLFDDDGLTLIVRKQDGSRRKFKAVPE